MGRDNNEDSGRFGGGGGGFFVIKGGYELGRAGSLGKKNEKIDSRLISIPFWLRFEARATETSSCLYEADDNGFKGGC